MSKRTALLLSYGIFKNNFYSSSKLAEEGVTKRGHKEEFKNISGRMSRRRRCKQRTWRRSSSVEGEARNSQSNRKFLLLLKRGNATESNSQCKVKTIEFLCILLIVAR